MYVEFAFAGSSKFTELVARIGVVVATALILMLRLFAATEDMKIMNYPTYGPVSIVSASAEKTKLFLITTSDLFRVTMIQDYIIKVKGIT